MKISEYDTKLPKNKKAQDKNLVLHTTQTRVVGKFTVTPWQQLPYLAGLVLEEALPTQPH